MSIPAPATEHLRVPGVAHAGRTGSVQRRAWPPAARASAVVLGLWVLRVLTEPWLGAGLHVDEAQYWWWSRDLDWGYASKPPLIAGLIAASTALFGDGVLGVRLLCMACWPATAFVLYRLAAAMVGASGSGASSALGGDGTGDLSARAGLTAALLFIASPLAGTLGLVATTDGPLLLCWALALWGLWRGVVGQHAGGWVMFGLAVTLGLLAKYTLAALLPGALWFAARHGGPRALRSALIALAGSVMLLVPHAVWNGLHGWPALHHTADITLGSERTGSAWLRVGSLLLAQPLLLGPAAAFALAGRGRLQPPARTLLLATALPLLVAGIAQAAHGRVEVNWVAPVLLSAVLALAVRPASAQRATGRGRALGAALAVQTLLVTGLVFLPALWQRGPSSGYPPAALDAWARMRGWDTALADLRARWPGPRPLTGGVLIGVDRTALAHALYAWRDLPWEPTSWRADTPYAVDRPLACALAEPGPFLIITEGRGDLPAALVAQFESVHLRASSTVPRSRHRALTLSLYEAGQPRPQNGNCP